MAVFTEFTGNDGDPWPSPWTIPSGTGTIQNNRGRLSKATAAWTSGDAVAGVNIARTNVSGTMLVHDAALDAYQQVLIRWIDDFNYFSAEFYPPTGLWEVKVWVSGVDTLLGSYTVAGVANGTLLRFEFQADGQTVALRTWRDVDQEPASWQVESGGQTDHASGDVVLSINSASTVADYMDVDDLQVIDLAHAPSITDSAGLTDTGSWSATGDSDGVNFVDEVVATLTASVTDHTRAVTNNLGIADTGSWSATGESDGVGLTDEVVAILDLSGSPNDHVRTVTDPIGIVDDDAPFSIRHRFTFTDPIGVADDDETYRVEYGITLTDQITSTDSALAGPGGNSQDIQLGTALEANTSWPLSVDNPRSYLLATATETDTAHALTVAADASLLLGRGTELDTAYPLTVSNPRSYALGTALESDSAGSISASTVTGSTIRAFGGLLRSPSGIVRPAL